MGRTRTLLGASTKSLEQRRLPRQLTGTPKSAGSLNLSRMRTLAPEPGRGPLRCQDMDHQLLNLLRMHSLHGCR